MLTLFVTIIVVLLATEIAATKQFNANKDYEDSTNLVSNEFDLDTSGMIQIYKNASGLSVMAPRTVASTHPLARQLNELTLSQDPSKDDYIKDIYLKTLQQRVEMGIFSSVAMGGVSEKFSSNFRSRRRLNGDWDKVNELLSTLIVKFDMTNTDYYLTRDEAWDLLDDFLSNYDREDDFDPMWESIMATHSNFKADSKIRCVDLKLFTDAYKNGTMKDKVPPCPTHNFVTPEFKSGEKLAPGVYLRALWLGLASNEHISDNWAKENVCSNIKIGGITVKHSVSSNIQGSGSKQGKSYDIDVIVHEITASCRLSLRVKLKTGLKYHGNVGVQLEKKRDVANSFELKLRVTNKENNLSVNPPDTISVVNCSTGFHICRDNEEDRVLHPDCEHWSDRDIHASIGTRVAPYEKAYDEAEMLVGEIICPSSTDFILLKPMQMMIDTISNMSREYLHPWLDPVAGEQFCHITDWYDGTGRFKYKSEFGVSPEERNSKEMREARFKWAEEQCIKSGSNCVGLQYRDEPDTDNDIYFAYSMLGEPCPSRSKPVVDENECNSLKDQSKKLISGAFIVDGQTWTSRPAAQPGTSLNDDDNLNSEFCILTFQHIQCDVPEENGTIKWSKSGNIQHIKLNASKVDLVKTSYRICKRDEDMSEWRNSIAPCASFHNAGSWRRTTTDADLIGKSTDVVTGGTQCNIPFYIDTPATCKFPDSGTLEYDQWIMTCSLQITNIQCFANRNICKWDTNTETCVLKPVTDSERCYSTVNEMGIKDNMGIALPPTRKTCIGPVCQYIGLMKTKHEDCVTQNTSIPMCVTTHDVSDDVEKPSNAISRWGFCDNEAKNASSRKIQYASEGWVVKKKSPFALGGDSLSHEKMLKQQQDVNHLLQPGDVDLWKVNDDRNTLLKWVRSALDIILQPADKNETELGLNYIIRQIFSQGSVSIPLNMTLINTCEKGKVCFQERKTIDSSESKEPEKIRRLSSKQKNNSNSTASSVATSFTRRLVGNTDRNLPQPACSAPPKIAEPENLIELTKSVNLAEARVTLDFVEIHGIDSFTSGKFFESIPGSDYTLHNSIKMSKNGNLKARFHFSYTVVPATELIEESTKKVIQRILDHQGDDGLVDVPYYLHETGGYFEVGLKDISLEMDTMIAVDKEKQAQITLGQIANSPVQCLMTIFHELVVSKSIVSIDDDVTFNISGLLDVGIENIIKSSFEALKDIYFPSIINGLPAFAQEKVSTHINGFIENLVNPFKWISQAEVNSVERRICVESVWPDGSDSKTLSLKDAKTKCEQLPIGVDNPCAGVRAKKCNSKSDPDGVLNSYCETIMCSSMPLLVNILENSTASRAPPGWVDHVKANAAADICPAYTESNASTWMDVTIGDLLKTYNAPENIDEAVEMMKKTLPQNVNLINLEESDNMSNILIFINDELSVQKGEQWVGHRNVGLTVFANGDDTKYTSPEAMSKCRYLGKRHCGAIMCDSLNNCQIMKWNVPKKQAIVRDNRPKCSGCIDCETVDESNDVPTFDCTNCSMCECDCTQPIVKSFKGYTTWEVVPAILGINAYAKKIGMMSFDINLKIGPIINPYGNAASENETFTMEIKSLKIPKFDSFTQFEPVKVTSPYSVKNKIKLHHLDVEFEVVVTTGSKKNPISENVVFQTGLNQIEVDIDSIFAVDTDKFSALRIGSIIDKPLECLLSSIYRFEVIAAKINVGDNGRDSKAVRGLKMYPKFRNTVLASAASMALDAFRVMLESSLEDSLLNQLIHHVGRDIFNSLLKKYFSPHTWTAIRDGSKLCIPMKWPERIEKPYTLDAAKEACESLKKCSGVRVKAVQNNGFEACSKLQNNFKYRVTTGELLNVTTPGKYQFTPAMKINPSLRPRCKFPFRVISDDGFSSTLHHDCIEDSHNRKSTYCFLEIDSRGIGSVRDICEHDGIGTDPINLWKIYQMTPNNEVKCGQPKNPGTLSLFNFQNDEVIRKIKGIIHEYIEDGSDGLQGMCPRITDMLSSDYVKPLGCKDINEEVIGPWTQKLSGEEGTLRVFSPFKKQTLEIVTHNEFQFQRLRIKNLNTLSPVKVLSSTHGPHTLENEILWGTKRPGKRIDKPLEIAFDTKWKSWRDSKISDPWYHMGNFAMNNEFESKLSLGDIHLFLNFIIEINKYEVANLRLDQLLVFPCILSILQNKSMAFKLLKFNIDFEKFNFFLNCHDCESPALRALDHLTKSPDAQAGLTLLVNNFADFVQRRLLSKRTFKTFDDWMQLSWGKCMVQSGQSVTYHEEWSKASKSEECIIGKWADGSETIGMEVTAAAQKCVEMGVLCRGIRVTTLESWYPHFGPSKYDGTEAFPCIGIKENLNINRAQPGFCFGQLTKKTDVFTKEECDKLGEAINENGVAFTHRWIKYADFKIDRNHSDIENDGVHDDIGLTDEEIILMRNGPLIGNSGTSWMGSKENEKQDLSFGEFSKEQNLTIGIGVCVLGMTIFMCLLAGIRTGRKKRRKAQAKLKKDIMSGKLGKLYSTAEATDLAFKQSMFNHPVVNSYAKWGVPILLMICYICFYLSHVKLCASVSLDLNLVSIPMFHELKPVSFSIIETLRMLYVSKTWPLFSLILLFSVVWPYLKVTLLCYCWFAQPGYLRSKSRGSTLERLDMLGKWSLIDIYIILIFMVAFSFSIESPSAMPILPPDFWNAKIVVVPEIGIYMFLFGVILSLITSHICIHNHRNIIAFNGSVEEDEYTANMIAVEQPTGQTSNNSCNDMCSENYKRNQATQNGFPTLDKFNPTSRRKLTNSRRITWFEKGTVDISENKEFFRHHKESLKDHVFEVKGATFRIKFRFLGKWSVATIILLAMLLISFGAVTPCFYIRNDGLVGLLQQWGEAESDYTEYSLFSAGLKIYRLSADSRFHTSLERLGVKFLSICYFGFSIFVPMLQLFMLLILWTVPMTLKGLKILTSINEIVGAWSAMEVLLISIATAVMELKPVSKGFTEPMLFICEPLESFMENAVLPFNLLEDRHSNCYEATSGLPAYTKEASLSSVYAIYFVVLASICNILVQRLLISLAESAMVTRERLMKGDTKALRIEAAMKDKLYQKGWRKKARSFAFDVFIKCCFIKMIDCDSKDDDREGIEMSTQQRITNKNTLGSMTEDEIKLVAENRLKYSLTHSRNFDEKQNETMQMTNTSNGEMTTLSSQHNMQDSSQNESFDRIPFPTRNSIYIPFPERDPSIIMPSVVATKSSTKFTFGEYNTCKDSQRRRSSIGVPVGFTEGKVIDVLNSNSFKRESQNHKSMKVVVGKPHTKSHTALPPVWSTVVDKEKANKTKPKYWNELTGISNRDFPFENEKINIMENNTASDMKNCENRNESHQQNRTSVSRRRYSTSEFGNTLAKLTNIKTEKDCKNIPILSNTNSVDISESKSNLNDSLDIIKKNAQRDTYRRILMTYTTNQLISLCETLDKTPPTRQDLLSSEEKEKFIDSIVFEKFPKFLSL